MYPAVIWDMWDRVLLSRGVGYMYRCLYGTVHSSIEVQWPPCIVSLMGQNTRTRYSLANGANQGKQQMEHPQNMGVPCRLPVELCLERDVGS